MGKTRNLLVQVLQNFSFGHREKRVYCMHFKTSNESTLLDLRVLKGGLQVGKGSWAPEQNKKGLQYESPNWTRIEMKMFHSNFSKNNTGFLHEDEL